MSTTVATQIQAINSTIRELELRYGRPPDSVALLAVSKTKPVADIRSAVSAGQFRFGENYVNEALDKIITLRNEISDDQVLEWHHIGAIQSRKSRDIALHFNWAHGVDRLKVAQRLSRERELAQLPPLNVCVQVALDDEPGKAGAKPSMLTELADAIAELPGLKLRGLMSIPAPRSEFSAQRAVFAELKKLFDLLSEQHPGIDTLSCGMSADLEAAIAEGATLVRIGTAIFGAREARIQ